MKVCTKCSIEKDFNSFYKDKSQKSGLKPYCKDCDKKYTRSAEAISRGRVINKNYKSPNKVYNDKKYRMTDSGKANKLRCKNKRRNLIGQHTLTATELNQIRELFQNKCAYCDSVDNITLDHVIPVSKGGNTTINNIILACRSCNCKRGNKDIFLFASKERYILITEKLMRL